MTSRNRNRRPASRRTSPARGFSLLELLVGVVIGLIAVAVIFQTFSVAEGLKRNTTAAGDAQTTGLLSTFVLGQELGNAGAAMMPSAGDLATCPSTASFKTNLRPVPLVIYDGGADNISDSVDVYYSVARSLISVALFMASAAPGTDFLVQSPTQIVAGKPLGGFNIGDLAVALDGTGNCELTRITGAVPEAGATPTGTTGNVTLAHTAVANTYSPGPDSAGLMNFGPVGSVQKVHYDVTPSTDPTSPNVLRSQSLLDPATGMPDIAGVQPRNPIAGNIVLLKVQYGISNVVGTGTYLDTWVKGTGAWDSSVLLGPLSVVALNQTVSQIKAVRIGVIVRSDQPISSLDANGSDWQKYAAAGFPWVLFDCPAHDATCPGRLTGTIGAFNGQFYRYRIYEQEIPLRNALWNRS